MKDNGHGWMKDLNTFVQYLTEQEFERNYPSRRGPPANIIEYMKGDKSGIVPIMTNSGILSSNLEIMHTENQQPH